MNLPERIDDPSLLDYEPLCSYIAIYECTEGQSRSSGESSVSQFVEEMRKDGQATAAAKRWAYLVFKDVLSDENSLAVTNNGVKLYKTFFKYQFLLHQGLQHGNIEQANRFEAYIYKKGIKAIGLEDGGQHSAPGRDNVGKSKDQDNRRSSRSTGSRKVPHPVETGICHPGAGDIVTSPSVGCKSHSTTGRLAIQQESPAIGARLPILPEATKPSKRSVTKNKKKRKASSQNPPIITPSDASEDDKEPSETCAVAAANSIFHPNSVSHRSKRISSDPSRQPHDLLGVEKQVDTTNPAHRHETNKQQREVTSISHPRSSLASFKPNEFVSQVRIKGRHGTRFPLSGRKPDRERSLKISAQLTRVRFNFRRLRKIKSVGGFQEPPANKRMRRASRSTLERELGVRSDSTCDLRANPSLQATFQGPLVVGPLLTEENIRAKSKAPRKRTRLEFEKASVASDEDASVVSHESLGPDTRLLRPLPQKVRDVHLVPATGEDGAVHGVPRVVPSLEHADQLLRDAASNASTVLQEGPDVTDWTQDEEQDAECDDLDMDDQDEENDVQAAALPSVTPKPPVPAPPHIWAQSRQEVCESFEYFRCYHGGVYSKDDVVKGYLLGAYAASRDIFHHEGKLIISHGGGKSESTLDTRKGPKRYQTDQDQEASDKSVRALLKTCKDRRPIVLLADDKYALFPYDLASANYTYVVLGLYWISHAWAECQPARDGSGRIVRWKFAFQWCEGQGDPWWLPQQEMTDITSHPPKSISNSRMRRIEDSSNPANTDEDASVQCKACQERSPFVYKQGWMCLNTRCDAFWSMDGEDPQQLDYREEFLMLLPQTFERLPNITPARAMETPSGITTTYAFSKGWHCTKCGRLSCRYKWECWECSSCKFKYVVNGRVRSPKEFWHQRPSKGFLHSQVGKDSGIVACRLEPINLGTRKGFTSRLTFILPHDRGKIHLILGTPLSNGDADNIFRLYQQQASNGDLKLRRYPLRNHRARGLLLTNYFSQNSGEPYQYVGGSGHTVPFHEAPDCVRRALALIKERSSLALSADVPFNEILSAAYMERQKMSFHSDSEKELGPIVASLSLGSAALMHFRQHVDIENPKARSTYALSLVLRHGDVLIMDGDGVQKHYEHTVVPMNFRIAATARCIGST